MDFALKTVIYVAKANITEQRIPTVAAHLA